MEDAKKIDISGRPADEEVKHKDGTNAPGCPFWFFGNEDSADNDLKEKFEVIDDEKKN